MPLSGTALCTVQLCDFGVFAPLSGLRRIPPWSESGKRITDEGTQLTTWPAGAAHPQVSDAAIWNEEEWAAPEPFTPSPKRDGYWWTNWPQTFGYVAPFRQVPRTLEELKKAVIGEITSVGPDPTPVKAVGGGWSFTDASLPFTSAAEVNNASLVKKGTWQRQDLRNVLYGFEDTYPTPMDLWSEAVTRSSTTFNTYDQSKHLRVTRSGVHLPASSEVRLIDTRSLASSLQCEFEDYRAASDERLREILFHVEAGITMADLQQLLNHQHPPLAIRATGGSPGATLAGALSTATHGGEFTQPLLVDCVRAVHLVGPGGEQWWIEGDVPVAVYAKLHKRYPKIHPDHFIAAGWNAIPGLSSQDVLNAVVVSMGTMGVIYSMVIAVVKQFGIRQVVHPTTWSELLKAAGTTKEDLRSGQAAANQAVLRHLKHGELNGTGIPHSKNEYIDLAINPLNRDCWIVNRRVTEGLPEDSNNPPTGVGNYMTALSRALQQHSRSALQGSMFGGRVFDFLYWGADLVNLAAHDIGKVTSLLGFLTDSADPLGMLLAVGSAQTVLNTIYQTSSPDRKHQFLADLLSGFFHALEGTEPGKNSDITGVSNQVGAIGWPASGLPGRGLEIALSHENAFTFLQQVLFDDVLVNDITGQNRPLLGYISIRVCPKTNSLLGMQQYGPHSVMIEVVAYRSPEANEVMDSIQEKALTWQGPGPKPLLHWGLENNMVDHAYLVGTPLGELYKAGMTRLEAFRKIRNFLRHGNLPVFDNTFSARIGV